MGHIVIVIPGIMGSELQLNREVIWPGSVSDLILPYTHMAELMNPNLIVTDVIRSFSISTQYQSLLDDLQHCGFVENPRPAETKTLYVCPYDWRKDNREAASLLADIVDKATSQAGANPEVSLVAHSMGGLVGRYYLESGAFATRPGLSAVRRLITLATPHRGSPLALTAALGMEKRLFLNADQVKLLVNDSRYPSLYQLLPPFGEPFAWDAERGREYNHLDVYDTKVADALGLVRQNLKSAADFHKGLDINRRPIVNGKRVRYFFFVGTSQTTISAVTLIDKQTNPTSYRVLKLELEDAGDGTVPSWSGTVSGMQSQPVGGEHGTIYRSDTLRRTLGVLLGKPGVLAAAPTKVEISIRDRVIHPSDEVNLVLSFPTSTRLDGKIVISRAEIDQQGQLLGYRETQSTSVTYSGLSANKLHLVFPAPKQAGVYRVEYFEAGGTSSIASDELFVQEI